MSGAYYLEGGPGKACIIANMPWPMTSQTSSLDRDIHLALFSVKVGQQISFSIENASLEVGGKLSWHPLRGYTHHRLHEAWIGVPHVHNIRATVFLPFIPTDKTSSISVCGLWSTSTPRRRFVPGWWRLRTKKGQRGSRTHRWVDVFSCHLSMSLPASIVAAEQRSWRRMSV